MIEIYVLTAEGQKSEIRGQVWPSFTERTIPDLFLEKAFSLFSFSCKVTNIIGSVPLLYDCINPNYTLRALFPKVTIRLEFEHANSVCVAEEMGLSRFNLQHSGNHGMKDNPAVLRRWNTGQSFQDKSYERGILVYKLSSRVQRTVNFNQENILFKL